MNPAATDTEEFMALGNLNLCEKNESLGNPHKVVVDISNYVSETISENQLKNYSVHQKKEGLVDILVRSADECVGLFPSISENQLTELYSDPITETKADITWEDSILHCIHGEEADSETTIFDSLNTDLKLMKSAINPTTTDLGLPPPPKDVNMYPPDMCLGVILEIVADVTKSVSDDQLRDNLYWENAGPGKILDVVGGVSESTYRDISEKHSSESKSDMASEDVRPNYTNNKDDDANGNDVNLSCVNTDMDLNNLNLDALTVDIANLIGLKNSSSPCSPNSEPGNLVEGQRVVDDSKIINQPSANQFTELFSDPALETKDELGMVRMAGEDRMSEYVTSKEADVRSVTADEMDIININSTRSTTTKDELSMVGMRMAGEDSMPGYVTSKEADVRSVTADEVDIISISSTRNTTTTADTEDSTQLKDTSTEQQNDRLGIILDMVGGISESIYENISGNHLTEMYTAVPAHAQESKAEVYTDIATDNPRHSFLHSRDQENKAGKVDPVHHLNRSVTKTTTTDCGEVIIHQDASLVYLQKQGIGDALIRVDDGFGDLNTDGSSDNTNCIPPQLRPFFASLLQSAYLTDQANASLMETLTLSKHSMGLRDGELQYDGWNNVRKCLQGKSQLLDNLHHSLLLMIQQLLDQVHHVHRNEGAQQSTGQELSSEQDVTMEAFESFLQGKVKADQPKEPSAAQRMTAESNLLEGTQGLVQRVQRDPLHGMHSRQEQTRQPTKADGGYSVDSAGKASLKALQKRNCSRECTHVANCYGQKSLFVNKIGEVVQVPHASIHGDACETLNLQYPDEDIHQKEELRVSHELTMSHGTQSKTSDQQLKNMDNTLNLDVPSLKNCYSKNKDSEGKFETMPLVAMRNTTDVRLARITGLAIQYGSYHPWDSHSSPHWNHSMRNRIIHSALSSSYTNKACTRGFGLVTKTTSAWLEDAITHSTTEISMGSILHSEKTSSTTSTSKNTKASTSQISNLQTAAVNLTSQLPMGISQTSKMEVISDTDPAQCTTNRILHCTETETTNTFDAVQLSRTTSSNGDSETGDFVHENGSSQIRSCRCHCGAYFNSLQRFQQHLDKLHQERQMMFVCKFTICKGRVFDARQKEEYKMHLTDVHHVSQPYISEPVLLQYSKLCPHLTVNNILASEASAVTCITQEISSISQTGDECSDLRWNTNRDDAYAQDTSKRSRDPNVKYNSSVKKTIDMDGSIIEDAKLRNDSKNVCKDSSQLNQAEHSKRTRCQNTKLCERKRILCNDTSKMSSSKTLKGSDASQESKLTEGPVLARKSSIHKKGTYKCTNCGNGFRSLNSLRQHEIVHTNEGLGYICDEGKCSGHAYFLNRKNDFIHHLQNVHKIKKPVIPEPIMLRFSKIGNMKRTAIRLFNTASPKKYSQQESTHVELCNQTTLGAADIEKAKNNSDSNTEENICNVTGCSKIKAIVSESKQCDQVIEKQQTKCPGPPVPVKMAENVTQHSINSPILRSMKIHEVRDQTAEPGCLSEPEECVHEPPSLESHRGQAEPENLSSLCRRKDSRRIQGTKKKNCLYRKRLRSSSVISSRRPSSCVRADSREKTSGDVSVNTDKESVLRPDKPKQTKLNSAKMKKRRISVCNVSSSQILKGVNCKNQNVQQSRSRHNLNSRRTKYQLVKRGKMKTSIHSVALRRRNGTNSKGGCDGGSGDGNKSKLLKKTYQSRSELITNNNTGRISKHRPYKCSTCGVCLTSSGSLHHHAAIHRIVGLGYLCDDAKCNGHAFFYNRKNDYFRHLQTVHKIKKPILPAPEMLWFYKLGNGTRSAVRIYCAESVEKPSSQENPQVELCNQDIAGRECAENNSEGNTKAIDSKRKSVASAKDQWKQVVGEAQQANCFESSRVLVLAEEDDDQQMNSHPPTSQNSNLVEITDDAQDQNGGMRDLDEYEECQGMVYCLNRKTDRKTHLQNSCMVNNPVLQDTVKLNYSKAATKKRDQIIGIPLKQATSTDSRHELLPFSYHSLRSPIVEIADRKKKNSYLFTKQFRSKSDIKNRRFASPTRQSPRNHHSKYLNINNKEAAFRHCEPARTKAVSKDQKGKTALCNTSSSKRFNDINNKLKNGHKKFFRYRHMTNAKQSSCQYKRIKKASLKTRSGRSKSVEGSGYDSKEAKLVETPDPIENQQTKNCSTSKRHNKGIYKCRSCDSVLKSATSLLRHENVHRKVGLGYLCNEGKCIGRAFFHSRKTDFMRHQQNVHKIKKPVIPEPIMLRFSKIGNKRRAIQIHNTASVEEPSQQENALGEFCNQTIAGAANVESACRSSGSDIEANVRSTDCKLKPAASEDKQCKQVVEGQQDKYAESTQVMRMKERYGFNSPVSGSLKPLESQNQKEGLGYLCEYESCQGKAYHINRKSDYRIHLLKVHNVINPVFQEPVMLKFSKTGTKKTSPIIGIQLDKAASISSYPATDSSTASFFVTDRSPIVQRNKTTLKDAFLQTKHNNNSSSSVSYASESARHDSLEDVSMNADEDNVFMASKPSVSKHPLAKCYPGMTSVCNVSSSNNLKEVTSPNNNIHISLHSPTVISERTSFQSGIPGKPVMKMVHRDTSKAQNWKYLKGGGDGDIESKLAADLKTTESQRFKKCNTSKIHRNVTYKCSDCGCCFTSAESFRQHEDKPNKAAPSFIRRNNSGQGQASFLESALRIKNPVTTDPMLQFLKGTKRWCIVTLDNPAPLQTRPQQERIQVDLNGPAEGAIVEDIYDSHTKENVDSIDHNKAKQSVSEGRSWDQVTEEPRTMVRTFQSN